MRSSSMAGERGAAGPGYTQTRKHTHTQQNKTTGVWASWCEHSLNGVDRLLKSILMSSPDSWWQNLRIHLVKSSLKTVPDNRMSLNPLWTMQTCKFHWAVQLKKKTVLSWSQTADMKCKLQPMTNKITMFLPVDQSNEVQWHDNRIWQTYMSIFPSSSNWPDSMERGPEYTYTEISFQDLWQVPDPNMQCERLYQ